MSTFWLIYWIAFGSIIILSLLVAFLFDLDGDNISFSYVALVVFLGAIPAANLLVGLCLIIGVLIAIFEENITPKF